MNSITSRLSKRLLALYGFVDFSCASILDVGADHALFSLGLIQKGFQGMVYASEKGDGPYKRMLQGLISYEEGKKVVPLKGDGLKALKGHEVEEIVIAGMGGETILQILSEGKEGLSGVKRLVLEPQSQRELFFTGMNRLGYRLLQEKYVEEHGHVYPLCAYEKGDEELGEFGGVFGTKALEEKDPVLKEFLKRQVRIYRELDQEEKGAVPEVKERLALYEKALKEF